MPTRDRLRVLLVEDGEDDLAMLLAALRLHFAAVDHMCVDSVPALRSALRERTWDIVLTDHNLPAMNAVMAVDIVREMAGGLPVVVVSSEIPRALAEMALQRGASRVVYKSRLEDVVPAVLAALGEASTQA